MGHASRKFSFLVEGIFLFSGLGKLDSWPVIKLDVFWKACIFRVALVLLEYEEYSAYQKNMILITFVLLLFGCIDRTKLNNASHINSIEKRAQPQSWITSPQHVLGSKKMTLKLARDLKLRQTLFCANWEAPRPNRAKRANKNPKMMASCLFLRPTGTLISSPQSQTQNHSKHFLGPQWFHSYW